MNRLLELTQLFLKLGIIGFGGPATHIAMMEDEVVTRRNWMSRDHFLDIVGATNLIPGPNSTEMTMHVGYHRAGWPGLIVAGSCFILPAVLITAALAWGYVQFGSLPQVAPFLIGIKPAILVIILGAVWKLGQKALKGWRLAVIGIGVLAAVFLGVNEVIALLGGGLIGMLWLRLSERWLGQAAALLLPIPGLRGGLADHLQAGQPPNLWELFLFFLRIGSILYGSGYVLVALLEGGLVHDLGWLTQQQLLDAIAIGQFTPGPVLSTATFIGYLILGLPGAIVATAGIFLPSFIFVGLLNPIIPRLRQLSWTAAFLDAVNISAVALILAVLINLGRTTLTAWPAWVIAILATVATFRFKLSSAWVVLGGAVLGWLVSWLV